LQLRGPWTPRTRRRHGDRLPDESRDTTCKHTDVTIVWWRGNTSRTPATPSTTTGKRTPATNDRRRERARTIRATAGVPRSDCTRCAPAGGVARRTWRPARRVGRHSTDRPYDCERSTGETATTDLSVLEPVHEVLLRRVATGTRLRNPLVDLAHLPARHAPPHQVSLAEGVARAGVLDAQ